MGCDCCGPPAPAPEAVAAPVVVQSDEVGSCKDKCCDDGDGGDVSETVSLQEQKPVPVDDCCASGACAGDETKSDDDAPDCCRGKISPCCDTSCLDRIAMRECKLSATSVIGAKTQTSHENDYANPGSGCNGAADGKACSQHSLSALDRYSATLQALGCLCRTLIALGQESCCETPNRPSLDSHRSSTSVGSDRAAQNRLRLRKGSGDSNRSARGLSVNITCPKPSADGTNGKNTAPKGNCNDSCCSDGGTAVKPPAKAKCALPCCAKDELVKVDSVKNSQVDSCCPEKKPDKESAVKSGCAKSCCTKGKQPKKSVVKKNSIDGCCSKIPIGDPLPAQNKCSGSCCTKNEPVKPKGGCSDSCCSEVKPVLRPSNDGCAAACCEKEEKVPVDKMAVPCCSSSCCKPANLTKNPTDGCNKESCADSCCAEEQPKSAQGSCADDCCASDAPDTGMEIEEILVDPATDIENQATGNEHVVLSISGMTCTGCETKLNRTLATVPAVKNLKTSLVLSRAEFNIDLRLGSVEEVMKHLERKTEFKCEKVQSNGSYLDLIVPGDTSKFISQTWPEGVTDMVLVDKTTVRATFDPRVVGARDLAEKIWGPPVELAPPRGDISLEAGSKHVRHVGYTTLLSAVLTIPVLVMAWAPIPEREVAYSSASLALATIVQVVVAGPFYPKALKAFLFSRVIEMDLLIVLSTSAAYIFSVVSFAYHIAGRPLSTGQFFETSTLLVTLIMVGRWVAALARQRAVESISIRSLQAPTAMLIDQENGTVREIDARTLQYGDMFKLLPDTKVPTDGTVVTGSSEVDESMITGESRLVEKYPKSIVIAGSINGPGVMTVRLDRLQSENTIQAIAAMVDEAKLSKPKLQDLADRVATYFVPVVVTLTIITFVIWVAVGVAVRGHGGSEATINAITYAITVLIVSCPCAIGLAVPMVIVIGSGVAAERGIIFKSADAIEVAHKAAHVVFDKTGTLTRGKLSVVARECIDEASIPILLGLIENSRHPVSTAISAHFADSLIKVAAVSGIKSVSGKGIEATLGGRILRAGNSRWLNLTEHENVQMMLAQGYTVFCFTIDNELKAVFGLEDELRADAAQTVEDLQKRGVSVHVVSGDDDGAVQKLASKLNIPCDKVRSRSSPGDKKDYIQVLLGNETDRKKPIVVFCGDGTNDAVALAQATIGVHMNEGTDVAQSAADVVLMRPSLAGVLTMINVSQKAVNRIKFNFGWSFVYNTFAVLLAAGAFVNARILPQYAGLGELVSVLPVIAAAVLLRWSKI